MGLLDGRRRKHAHDIDVVIPLVKRLLARMDDPAFPHEQFPFSASDVNDILREAETLRDGLLGGLTPEPAFMRHVQRGCRGCIQALKRTRPDDVIAYVDTLESAKDRRLIRSM